MEVEARTLEEPALDDLGLVGLIVVDDEVDIEALGDGRLDSVEEPAKLNGAVALVTFGDDLSGLGVERCEEGGGAIANIVVGTALDLPRTHRQQGLGAVEGLDLGLFVDAQDQSSVRGMQIQADDVTHFLDEEGVGGELEGFTAMGLEREGPPDATDGALTHPGALRHGAGAPVRGVGGRFFQGDPDDALHILIPDRAGSSRSGLVQQPVHAPVHAPPPHEALAPFAHGLFGDPHFVGNLSICGSLGGPKDDAGPRIARAWAVLGRFTQRSKVS